MSLLSSQDGVGSATSPEGSGIEVERSRQYSLRLQRARQANKNRNSTRNSTYPPSDPGGSPDVSKLSVKIEGGSAASSPTKGDGFSGVPQEITRPAEPRWWTVIEGAEHRAGSQWAWSSQKELLAVVDQEQELRLMTSRGEVRYRVQLPKEGRTIFVGWEKSGSVLAAVQKLGGAFLWFPAKPEAVQQWEGMQFSSKLLKNAVLKRNAHFDTIFASWSPKGKLVLGLADGNFAVWDLASNETFMSRKHFAGKHKGAIAAGAWGPHGDMLALASAGQLKVSQPLVNASWENTAAKLALDSEDLVYQELRYSLSGDFLAAFAGSSIFRHLCLYRVTPMGKKGTESKLVPVGEAHPSTELGALQAMLWLENDILALCTSNGCIRLLKYDVHDGELREEQYQPCGDGVSDAAVLSSGHIVMVNNECACIFNPLLTVDPIILAMAQLPKGARTGKIQSAEGFLLIAASNGSLLSLPLPKLESLDLSLITLISSAEEDVLPEATRIASGNTKPSQMGARSPSLLGEVTAADGATNTGLVSLKFTYSLQKSALAFINGHSELHVLVRKQGEGVFASMLKSSLPSSQCVFLAWETVTEANLAFALRGHGVGLWQYGTDSEINMWSGMAYRNNVFSFSKDKKTFDPNWAAWSKAGQLALGLADGNFAVWDSVSSGISVSHKMGRHKSAITTGAWLSSLFAPALALASTSTIKVSQGFDTAEWGSTAMKLKLPKGKNRATSPRRSMTNLRSRADPEGLHFHALSFSPSGKYLAAIAAPTTDILQKVVIVYELQEQREAIVAIYEQPVDEDGTPYLIAWVQDDVLLVMLQSAESGAIKMLAPTKYRGSKRVWPPPSASPPGRLVDASVLPNGLIAAAFASAGSGTLLLFSTSCPKVHILSEMPTKEPLNVVLYGPAPDGSAVLGLSFASGGVEIWRV